MRCPFPFPLFTFHRLIRDSRDPLKQIPAHEIIPRCHQFVNRPSTFGSSQAIMQSCNHDASVEFQKTKNKKIAVIRLDEFLAVDAGIAAGVGILALGKSNEWVPRSQGTQCPDLYLYIIVGRLKWGWRKGKQELWGFCASYVFEHPPFASATTTGERHQTRPAQPARSKAAR